MEDLLNRASPVKSSNSSVLSGRPKESANVRSPTSRSVTSFVEDTRDRGQHRMWMDACRSGGRSWLECLSSSVNPRVQPLESWSLDTNVPMDEQRLSRSDQHCESRPLFTFETLGFMHNQLVSLSNAIRYTDWANKTLVRGSGAKYVQWRILVDLCLNSLNANTGAAGHSRSSAWKLCEPQYYLGSVLHCLVEPSTSPPGSNVQTP